MTYLYGFALREEVPFIADLLPDRLTDQERQQLLGRLAESGPSITL